jgi:hypothetical protein
MSQVLNEALHMQSLRLRYALNLSRKRLRKFEKKYKVSSEHFMKEWSAEDLAGSDMEYVEWAGEYKLFLIMKERLDALRGIKNVSA